MGSPKRGQGQILAAMRKQRGMPQKALADMLHFYPTHFFIEKILGRPDGEAWSIDVYHAADMGICGILAYRIGF